MSFVISTKATGANVDAALEEGTRDWNHAEEPVATEYPVFDRFAELFDRFLAPNVETFLPAVAPLSVAARPLYQAAQVALLVKIEEQVARLRHWFDSKAFDALRREVADIAKVDPGTLAPLEPTEVLERGLRLINSGSSGPVPTATVWVQFPGAQCNTLCAVQTKFTPDRLELSLSRAGANDMPLGAPLREFPVRYEQFPGDPIRRVLNVKNRAETTPAGQGNAKTIKRREKRLRKAERDRREAERQQPPPVQQEPHR